MSLELQLLQAYNLHATYVPYLSNFDVKVVKECFNSAIPLAHKDGVLRR